MTMTEHSPFAGNRVERRKPHEIRHAPISEKQARFLTALARADMVRLGAPLEDVERLTTEFMATISTKEQASGCIDALLKLVKPVWDPIDPTAPKPIDEDGFYVDRSTDPATVYTVQRAVHGSGNLYAKVLVIPEDHSAKGYFEYVGRGPLKLPLEKLTLELAKKLGHLYGRCYVCGATLTNEKSIEAGIGPVCSGRLS